LGAVRFDEEFVGYGLEDRHFAWLLDKVGISFEFLYTAIIYHDHAAPNRPRSQKDEELQINKKMFYEKIGK
jgi:predicted 3-demethylubiquinone-9 3-methyltransferase (glyoxalase superfamily)